MLALTVSGCSLIAADTCVSHPSRSQVLHRKCLVPTPAGHWKGSMTRERHAGADSFGPSKALRQCI